MMRSPQRVLADAAAWLDVPVAQLLGKRGGPEICKARHLAIVVVQQQSDLDICGVARVFGRHHSTCINSFRRVNADLELAEQAADLCRAVRCTTALEVGMALSMLTLAERRNVVACLKVLLGEVRAYSALAIAGLRILASRPDAAQTAAELLVNIDRGRRDRQYWRDTPGGIVTRIRLQAEHARIPWAVATGRRDAAR